MFFLSLMLNIIVYDKIFFIDSKLILYFQKVLSNIYKFYQRIILHVIFSIYLFQI